MNVNLNIRIMIFFKKLNNYSFMCKTARSSVIEILDHSRSHQQWVLVDDHVIEYVRWA